MVILIAAVVAALALGIVLVVVLVRWATTLSSRSAERARDVPHERVRDTPLKWPEPRRPGDGS